MCGPAFQYQSTRSAYQIENAHGGRSLGLDSGVSLLVGLLKLPGEPTVTHDEADRVRGCSGQRRPQLVQLVPWAARWADRIHALLVFHCLPGAAVAGHLCLQSVQLAE